MNVCRQFHRSGGQRCQHKNRAYKGDSPSCQRTTISIPSRPIPSFIFKAISGRERRLILATGWRTRRWGVKFGKQWMSDDFPRMIAVTFQHPTPYFEDFIAVNYPNNGPLWRRFAEGVDSVSGAAFPSKPRTVSASLDGRINGWVGITRARTLSS
jgi:hypothetical protein